MKMSAAITPKTTPVMPLTSLGDNIWLAGVCCQYGIDKQECSEAYDDYSHYEIIDFRR